MSGSRSIHPVSAGFLVRWLETALAAKSAKTREGYGYAVRRLFVFLEREGFPTELADLKPFHLRAFLAEIRNDGASLNSVAHFDRTLRAIFRRVEREGREDFDLPESWRNPFGSVEQQRPVPVRKQPLSTEQAHQLLRGLPRRGFLAYRNYAQIAFMLMTGSRSIEIRNLRVRNIDLQQRLADLRVTKGGKPRIVYFSSRLAQILSNYLRRRERAVGSVSDYLFPTRDGKRQSTRSLHRTVKRAGDHVGLSGLGPHRLRHSYVTLSHADGAPMKFLQEQCGHSSILITQGYISLSHDQKSQLAERYSNW
jgi:integrase/recombinase XerC